MPISLKHRGGTGILENALGLIQSSQKLFSKKKKSFVDKLVCQWFVWENKLWMVEKQALLSEEVLCQLSTPCKGKQCHRRVIHLTNFYVIKSLKCLTIFHASFKNLYSVILNYTMLKIDLILKWKRLVLQRDIENMFSKNNTINLNTFQRGIYTRFIFSWCYPKIIVCIMTNIYNSLMCKLTYKPILPNISNTYSKHSIIS